MSDKRYTPQEAAIMVLAKAQELYKASPLAKGDWNKIHNKLEGEGYSKESADKIDGAIKAKVEEKKLHKDEGMDPSMAMSEDAPKEEPKEKPMKGPYKLAKWCGRMEHKRGQAQKQSAPAPELDKSAEDTSKMSGKTGLVGSGETGHEAGVNIRGNNGSSHGMSAAGNAVRNAAHSMPKQASAQINGAKEMHRQTLDQIHQMTKPKLPG